MKPESPYKKFKIWLTDKNITDLDESTINAISPITVLAMFASLDKFTIYLNDNFNTFNHLKYDNMSFYKMLKTFCINNNITIYDLSFINLKKEKEEYKKIKQLFPDLKSYEINYIVENSKDDTILEYMPNFKIKSTKGKSK